MLNCDYNVNNRGIGVIHPSGSCDVNIFMETYLACLPIPDNVKNANCVVTSPKGTIYNLNQLKNSNHVATFKGSQTFSNGTKFIIGICNPVLYGHEAACEAGTSVCRFDSKGEKFTSQYVNMGMQTQDFTFEGEHMILTLPSNEPCGNKEKFSSRIHFECDHDGHNNDPEYHSTAGCTHIFSFATPAACSNKKPCTVENAVTKASYDFSSLAGIQYEAVNKNKSDEKIKFSICLDAGEPCMKNSGSCIVKGDQSTSAGSVNADLMLGAENKNPYLVYKNGAVCKKVGQTFTTRIDFICADNSTDEESVVIEDGCDITIHFKTLLACDFIKNCIGKDRNGEEIDLRPLIDFDGNYIATVNEKNLPNETGNVQYLLNVCRPLNSKYSLNCRGASGACRTVIDKNGKHEQEISLGHPDYSIFVGKVGETNEVTMKYFNGGDCTKGANETITTQIRFYCDEKAGLGKPVLQAINDCQYEFDFPTNILCNEQSIDLQNKTNLCILANDEVSIDLKLFGEDGKYKVGNTLVDICGGDEKKFYSIVYKQSMVRVEFAKGSGKGECGSNRGLENLKKFGSS